MLEIKNILQIQKLKVYFLLILGFKKKLKGKYKLYLESNVKEYSL